MIDQRIFHFDWHDNNGLRLGSKLYIRGVRHTNNLLL